MPASSDIYSQLHPVQPVNRLAQLAQALQVKSLQDEQGMNTLRRDEYTRGVERKNKLESILSSGGGETELMRGGFLDEATRLGKDRRENAKTDADTDSKRTETALKTIGMFRNAAMNVRNPEEAAFLVNSMFDHPTIASTGLGKVPRESFMPTAADPAGFEDWKKQFVLGADEFIKLNAPKVTTMNLGGSTQMVATPGLGGAPQVIGRAQNTQSPDSAATVAQSERNSQRVDARARDANNIAAQGNTAKTETELRKEFADLPEVKRYKSAFPSFKAIESAAKTNNRQADINLIYGLAKLYDPESVVREGEYNTIANSQAIPDWLKGAAQSIVGGSRLSNNTKAQILEQARGRIATFEGEYQKAVGAYEGIAKGRGANTQNVIPPVGRVVDFGSLK